MQLYIITTIAEPVPDAATVSKVSDSETSTAASLGERPSITCMI